MINISFRFSTTGLPRPNATKLLYIKLLSFLPVKFPTSPNKKSCFHAFKELREAHCLKRNDPKIQQNNVLFSFVSSFVAKKLVNIFKINPYLIHVVCHLRSGKNFVKFFTLQ